MEAYYADLLTRKLTLQIQCDFHAGFYMKVSSLIIETLYYIWCCFCRLELHGPLAVPRFKILWKILRCSPPGQTKVNFIYSMQSIF